MAQVRSVRRPFVSRRRGRVNDAKSTPSGQPQEPQQAPAPQPEIITIDLPPLPDASDEEREAPGTGQEMQTVEAPADGTKTVLEVEESKSEAVSKVDYSSWTVSQLAGELKRRELPSSGVKTELIARLKASDAEQSTQA